MDVAEFLSEILANGPVDVLEVEGKHGLAALLVARFIQIDG